MTTTRAERAEAVLRLRSRGLTQVRISDELRLSRSYVSAIVADPTGEKERRRRERYRRPCPKCGTLMTGCNGHGSSAPKLCATCAAANAPKEWTREKIIAAIQRWANEHGRPPTSTDWRRVSSDSYWPNAGTVVQTLGWANAVEAAGFPRPHTGLRPERVIACADCGDEVRTRAPSTRRCRDCQGKHERERRRGGAQNREYQREYWRNRWRSDPAYREKCRQYQREYVARRRLADPEYREKRKQYQREWKRRKREAQKAA